jgi:hypothetical protein
VAAAAALPPMKWRLSMVSSPECPAFAVSSLGRCYRPPLRAGKRDYASMIATARVQPAEPPRTLTGKQLTVKPLGGSASRLCSFSIWQ